MSDKNINDSNNENNNDKDKPLSQSTVPTSIKNNNQPSMTPPTIGPTQTTKDTATTNNNRQISKDNDNENYNNNNSFSPRVENLTKSENNTNHKSTTTTKPPPPLQNKSQTSNPNNDPTSVEKEKNVVQPSAATTTPDVAATAESKQTTAPQTVQAAKDKQNIQMKNNDTIKTIDSSTTIPKEKITTTTSSAETKIIVNASPTTAASVPVAESAPTKTYTSKVTTANINKKQEQSDHKIESNENPSIHSSKLTNTEVKEISSSVQISKDETLQNNKSNSGITNNDHSATSKTKPKQSDLLAANKTTAMGKSASEPPPPPTTTATILKKSQNSFIISNFAAVSQPVSRKQEPKTVVAEADTAAATEATSNNQDTSIPVSDTAQSFNKETEVSSKKYPTMLVDDATPTQAGNLTNNVLTNNDTNADAVTKGDSNTGHTIDMNVDHESTNLAARTENTVEPQKQEQQQPLEEEQNDNSIEMQLQQENNNNDNDQDLDEEQADPRLLPVESETDETSSTSTVDSNVAFSDSSEYDNLIGDDNNDNHNQDDNYNNNVVANNNKASSHKGRKRPHESIQQHMSQQIVQEPTKVLEQYIQHEIANEIQAAWHAQRKLIQAYITKLSDNNAPKRTRR